MHDKFGIRLLVFILAAGCGGGSATGIKANAMPAGGNFTGVYFSPQYGEMNVIQTGSSVVGDYRKDERSGRINGTVEGDLLRFEWVEEKAMISNRTTETKGRGYFRYMIDATNGDHILKGEWGVGDNDTGGGPWNAWKSTKSQPKLTGVGKSNGVEKPIGKDSSDQSDESGGGSTGNGSDDLL
jgi:hypothetical protein